MASGRGDGHVHGEGPPGGLRLQWRVCGAKGESQHRGHRGQGGRAVVGSHVYMFIFLPDWQQPDPYYPVTSSLPKKRLHYVPTLSVRINSHLFPEEAR